ncbi:hypothetical protein [Gemmata sp. SH-PL17]|uniref:hypothetical protein n=1 Tax=Gemmata sp. SH-PL17 TaxID=1630693 RepID=UPI0012FA00E5|nr:hypothetical protein [Gemmata sp. SH-PL17]
MSGTVLILLALMGVPAMPLALMGAGLGLVGAIVGFRVARSAQCRDPDERPVMPPAIARDPELARAYHILCEALTEVATRPNGILKEALTQKLVALGVQLRALATGANTFPGTTSWYVAHDAVLTMPELKAYRSVSWVQSVASVHEPPLQESVRAIFAAAHRGVFVERILVLPELLWPAEQTLPVRAILPWLEDQQAQGFRVILVPERALDPGTGPLVDTCVFDDWGVGTRDVDDRSETARVTLDFASVTIRAALERLDRLSRVGIPFGELLERAARSG